MGKKILVVDDDPAIRSYLSALLSDNGYEVATAADAEEGMNLAKSDMPDLITLDIEMPGEWGPRFYRQLSKDKTLKEIPVIIISGLSGQQYAVPKAVASISKPFDRAELLSIIKQTLEDKKQ